MTEGERRRKGEKKISFLEPKREKIGSGRENYRKRERARERGRER